MSATFFTKFPRLPTEIQLQIVRESFPEPRSILVGIYTKPNPNNDQAINGQPGDGELLSSELRVTVSEHIVSPFLSVNKACRGEVLKHYPDIVGNTFAARKFQAQIYFNARTETIQLREDTFVPLNSARDTIFDWVFSRDETVLETRLRFLEGYFGNVQNLTISLRHIDSRQPGGRNNRARDSWLALLSYVLSNFTGLKRVRVYTPFSRSTANGSEDEIGYQIDTSKFRSIEELIAHHELPGQTRYLTPGLHQTTDWIQVWREWSPTRLDNHRPLPLAFNEGSFTKSCNFYSLLMTKNWFFVKIRPNWS